MGLPLLTVSTFLDVNDSSGRAQRHLAVVSDAQKQMHLLGTTPGSTAGGEGLKVLRPPQITKLPYTDA